MPTCERWCEVCWERFQMSNFFSVTREKNFSFDFSSRPKTIIHHRMVDCWVLWSLQRVQSAKQSEIVWGAWTHCRFDGLSLWEFWSKREQTIVKLIATMQVPSQDPHFDSIIWILRFSNTSTQFFRHGWSRNPLSIFDLGTILIHPSSLAYLPKHTITPFFWGRGNQVERTWTNLLFSKIYAGLVTRLLRQLVAKQPPIPSDHQLASLGCAAAMTLPFSCIKRIFLVGVRVCCA